MLKKRLLSIIFIILLFVLQTSAFCRISLNGAVPNLILILTISYALFRGEMDGMATGFVCGLLYDVFFMKFLGFFALLYTFIGFVIGKNHPYFTPRNYKIPLLSIVLSHIFLSVTTYIFLFLLTGHFEINIFLKEIILPEFVYTFLVFCMIYPLLTILEFKVLDMDWSLKRNDE